MVNRFRLEWWAAKITVGLISREIICEDDKEIYVYGFDLLLYTIVSVGCVLLLGAISGTFFQTAALLVAALPLQGLGGGFHAQTHLRCFMTMSCVWALSMFLLFLLPTHIIFVLAALGMYLIWKLAPIEHENAPMSAGKKIRMRWFARCYSICLYGVALLLSSISSLLTEAILLGVVVSGMSMAVAAMGKYRKHKESFDISIITSDN